MPSSREEFLRQMGISEEDTRDPSSVETKFVTAFSTSRSAPSDPQERHSPRAIPAHQGSRGLGESSALRSQAPAAPESPPPPPRREHKASVQSSASLSAREAFLASLQIDNMDDPETLAAPTAQPISKTLRRSEPITGNTAAAAAAAAAASSPQRNTASQEIFKDTAAIARAALDAGDAARASMPPPRSVGARSFISSEDEDAESRSAVDGAYRPPIRQDSIMGLRKASASKIASVCPQSSLPDRHDGCSPDELKCLGNKCFEEGEYRKAVRLYSKAIEKDPANAALYSNRSAAYLQAGKQMGVDTRTMALRDADKVIELRPMWFKGFSRRGDALFKLNRPAEAAEAYQRGLELDEGNINLMHSLGEAKAAAGGTKPAHASAWATAPPHKAKDVSSHHLVEELRRTMSSSNPTAKMGYDYRAEALQEFRAKRTNTSSLSSFCGEEERRTDRSIGKQQVPVAEVSSPAAKKLDRSQISEEFSSAAARNYQQNLLDAYRKKKQHVGGQ